MTPPRRTHAQARAEMRDGILRLGREQLSTRSAGELSVREIARDLGVASSAVYRHVKSREELVTLLVIDAYTELATVVGRPSENPEANIAIHDLAHRIRGWAVANPSRWALIYGTPVPGYAAPPDETTAPGTRVMAELLSVLARGTVRNDRPAPSSELAGQLITEAGDLGASHVEPALLASGVEAWTSLIGTISAEIFGQLGPEIKEFGKEFVDRWVSETCHTFSLSGRNLP